MLSQHQQPVAAAVVLLRAVPLRLRLGPVHSLRPQYVSRPLSVIPATYSFTYWLVHCHGCWAALWFLPLLLVLGALLCTTCCACFCYCAARYHYFRSRHVTGFARNMQRSYLVRWAVWHAPHQCHHGSRRLANARRTHTHTQSISSGLSEDLLRALPTFEFVPKDKSATATSSSINGDANALDQPDQESDDDESSAEDESYVVLLRGCCRPSS